MSTDVLGSLSFDTTPDVSGSSTIITDGTVQSISAGITAAQPAAGQVGRLYIDTTSLTLERDNGATWDSIGTTFTVSGTTNQIVSTPFAGGTTLSLSSDPVLPGSQGVTLPTGVTGARGSNVAGKLRLNSTLAYPEIGTGTEWLPLGRVLQVVSGNIAAQTATNSQTPLDATTPLSTEGTQIWTQSFTPISASSKIIITFSLTHVHGTATRTQICAVFAGTTNIGSQAVTCAVAASQYPGSMQVVYTPGSTAAITFSCRVGSSGTGTWYVNSGATNTLGGSMVSQYTIKEVL
jgi:hypothetical protein